MRCPNCGFRFTDQAHGRRIIDGEEELLEILRGDKTRMVYRTTDGNWCYSSPGNDHHVIDAAVVEELVSKNILRPCYTNTTDAYHLGRTLDVDRTLAARRAKGNRTENIYAGDPE